MRWKRNIGPRWSKRFAFLPAPIYGQWVWLEAYWVYREPGDDPMAYSLTDPNKEPTP